MKIAFVGTGNFARQHAAVLKTLGMEITSCYGANPQKTAAFANEFQCGVFPTAESLLSSTMDALHCYPTFCA